MISPMACGVGDGGHLGNVHGGQNDLGRYPGHSLGSVGWWVADFEWSGYGVCREVRVANIA